MACANQITAVITPDTRRNGYDRDQAAIECMHDDVHYVCTNIEVGRSSTKIQLLGQGTEWFNSVNFLFYKDGQPYDIYQDPNFSTYLNFR